MTLILTFINRYGIIHASDSNLTAADGTFAGVGAKTYPIAHLRAGVTVAGAFSVGGARMDSWMLEFIQLHASSGNQSLRDFSHQLKDTLQVQMDSREKMSGSMMHIAGYVQDNEQFHPEFWFVRNVQGINQITGEYTGIVDQFYISEDFWSRDCPQHHLMQAFQQGHFWVYVNGFAAGRMSFVMLQLVLNQVFWTIWRNPWKRVGSRFRGYDAITARLRRGRDAITVGGD